MNNTSAVYTQYCENGAAESAKILEYYNSLICNFEDYISELCEHKFMQGYRYAMSQIGQQD